MTGLKIIDGTPTAISKYLREEEIEKEADAYIENLYQNYGSGTGVLFGIPSDLRDSVRAIVKLIINAK